MSTLVVHVCHVESGKLLPIDDLKPSDNVAILKARLSTLVPPRQQILLFSGKTLPDGDSLSAVLVGKSPRIYLYDTGVLNSDHPAPLTSITPAPLPTSETPRKHPVTSGSSTEENELALLVYHFSLNLNRAKSLLSVLEARCKQFVQSRDEQVAQMEGLQHALLSAQRHHSTIHKACVDVKEKYQEMYNEHCELIDHFEENIERLKNTPLHPALQKDGKETLLYCVPDLEKSRSWVQTMRVQQEKARGLFEDMEARKGSVEKDLELLRETSMIVDVDVLDAELAKCQSGIDRVRAARDAFKSDLEDLTRVMEEKKITIHDVDAFNLRTTRHQGELKHFDSMMLISERLVEKASTSKSDTTAKLYEKLREIPRVEAAATDLGSKMILFEEVMGRNLKDMEYLCLIQRLPDAYAKTIEEVRRRRKYAAQARTRVERVLAYIMEERNVELDRRNAFVDGPGRFIPRDLVPGLRGEFLSRLDTEQLFSLLFGNDCDDALPPIEYDVGEQAEDEPSLSIPSALKERIADLQSSLSLPCNDDLIVAKETLVEERKAHERTQSRLQALKEELADREREYSATSASLEASLMEATEHEKSMRQLISANDSLEVSLCEANDRVDVLTTAFDAYRGDKEKDAAAHARSIRLLDEGNAALSQSLHKASARLEDITKKFDAYREEKEQERVDVETVLLENETLMHSRDKCRAELVELGKELKTKQREVALLREDVKSQLELSTQQGQRAARLEEERDRLKEQVRALEEARANQEDTMETLLSNRGAAESTSLSRLAAENETLRQEAMDAAEMMESIKLESAERDGELAELKHLKEELTTELEETKELLRRSSGSGAEERMMEASKLDGHASVVLGGFKTGDLVIFAASRGTYQAVHRDSPNYFLHPDQLDLLKEETSELPPIIVGEVILVTPLRWSRGVKPKLREGEELFHVFVDVMKDAVWVGEF